MDRELLCVVSEDLDFLFKEWNQDIDDASLRRSSPVLRSLLIDGLLGRAAREVGREIRILAPAICKVLTEDELKSMQFYQAGGAKHKGVELQAVTFTARIPSEQEMKASFDRTRGAIGKSYPEKLGIFLKQTSIAIDGVLINREEVIKYVANKLGGAHYDSSRVQPAGLNQVSLEGKYALLDKVRAGVFMADKNAVYYELLSIGQRLVNSRDVSHLRKQLRNILLTPAVIRL